MRTVAAVGPIVLTLMLVACAGSGDSGATSEGASSGAASAANFVEGRDYTVLERVRFMDAAGFEQPAEAFSVLLPRGWSHEGGVVWKGLQECRGEMVGARWSVTSPDGAIRYQVLPVHVWGSASDPTHLQLMHMARQQGGCEVGGVVDATQYLRDVFLPRELQGATIVDVRDNAPATQALRDGIRQNYAALTQYNAGGRSEFSADAVIANLSWPDGTEGIALVSVFNGVTTTVNPYTGMAQQLTNSNAPERSVLRFPASRRAEAEAILANIKSSYRTNPEWQTAVNGYFVRMRQQQDVIHHQRMQALAAQTAANTRAHQQRMADIQRQGAANTQRFEQRMAAMDANMRSWEAQQSSQDRMHTTFVQSIREVQTWQGGDGKVELSSGYDQAWSRGDGTYILSNSPSFDPRAVLQDQQWQELKPAKP